MLPSQKGSEIGYRFFNIDRLLLTADLALDDERTPVSYLRQPGDQPWKAHFTHPNFNLFTQPIWRGGIQAVLGMYTAHVLAKHVQRIDGISLPIQYKVGGIQVDPQVSRADRLDSP